MPFKSKEEAAAYLAGIIDGEGTIGRYGKDGIQSRRVSICGTESDIMSAVGEALTVLELPYSVSYAEYPPELGWASRIDIYIRGGRKSFQRLYEVVPIQSARKKRLLEDLLQSYRPERKSKEWLNTEYIQKERSLSSIAEECNVSPATIRNWLHSSGITCRSLSDAAEIDWRNRRDYNSIPK